MKERLGALEKKAKGTIFQEIVEEQIERYKKEKELELKRTTINNKWIDQADELLNLYEKICDKYEPQIEPFVAKVEFVDRRDEDGEVMLSVTDFRDKTISLKCADFHTLDDYGKLEDDQFVKKLDQEKEEGGVEFFFERDNPIKRVTHSEIFQADDPLAKLGEVVEPLFKDLFQKTFDLESLMEKETRAGDS
ncbi:hypothetical protein [Thermoactinomyces mirandus]|uniref:Uncharacterized protein n=1 Tax=Thermoactinomyces mirandus TaxID=2756294 RepID=A0A7W2AQX5_9BACL|nr:hypothetical protein [Thermoactinomyces mirandus]MBA4601958.1 hypothetical protein [Thermoactinomyces mirandus]